MENVVVDKEIHDSIVVAERSAGYITVFFVIKNPIGCRDSSTA